MTDHKRSLVRLSLAALALVALVGCGLKGGLERPPPQFGDARAAYEAEQKQKAENAAAEQAKKEREAKERQTMTIPAPSTSAQPPVDNPSQPQATPQ